MLKRFLLVLFAAGVVASGAFAQTPQVLMPGVTYDRKVVYTLGGRVVTNVITAPKPGGLYSLTPSLAATVIQSRAKLTQLERRLSGSATVAGVTGDVFPAGKGSSGLLEEDGVLQSFPDRVRSSLGISAGGRLVVQGVPFSGDWLGTGYLESLRGLNRPPVPGWTTLFTNQWGQRTPRQKGVVEAVLSSFPAARPGTELTGTVVRLASGGGQQIPRNGAVLSARGGARARLRSEARPGTVVTVRLFLRGGFAGIPNGMAGGPVLVRGGQPVFNVGEAFDPAQLARRLPRAAVGQRADGSILLVSVDGGRPGYSVGVTNYGLAQTMRQLGAVTAIALGTGKRAELAFAGNLLSRPAASERSVSTALLLSYTGVEAPPPSTAVLSPNQDGVGDVEQLSYKVVRPSRVTAALAGPQGASIPVVTNRPTSPGTHPLGWNGTDGHGHLEPEGQWTWKVTAVDSRGTSQASQSFSLNTTLAKLRTLWLPPSAGSTGRPLGVDFTLLRPATVTLQLETQTGAQIKVLHVAGYPAGAASYAWDGKVKGGRRLPRGRYQIRVTAVNTIGSMDLVAPFRVG